MTWPFFVIAQAIVVIASFLMAPVAVLCCSTSDRRHLTRWRWLETIDNDLSGDFGWKTFHLWGGNPLSWINRTRWLWRNGGNTVSYMVLGCDGDPAWNAQQDRALHFWRRPDGYWLYRRFVPLTKRRSMELFFGWNLFAVKFGRCKVVCQIRFPER